MTVVRNETVAARAKQKMNNNGEKPLDVVIFGFDLMSQQHFQRKMPKTVEQLERMEAAWFHYSRQFLTEYQDLPKFLLMHQDRFSHDDVNQIEVEDEHVAGHLADLEKSGLLDNAVLVVMADHGHRFTKIRDTHQGQLEERLPMFSIVLSKKLRASLRGKQMYANLLSNRDVLTTPFDVHQTLLDILNPPKDLITNQDTKARSLSLLRPIPKARRCEEASIEAHWCTCLNWQNAIKTELDVGQTKLLAEGGGGYRQATGADQGSLCQRHPQEGRLCQQVESGLTLLFHIAYRLVPNQTNLLNYKNVKDADGFVPLFGNAARAHFALYRLKIVTSPNDAIYGGTVFFEGRKSKIELEADLQSLSHVNAYGDDPHCVVDKQNTLALYCVCHDRVKPEKLK